MEIHKIPQLRRPVMVIAFGGWSDAGEAATGVITHLLEGDNTKTELNEIVPELIAEIDSEEFYDFQVNRPLISLDSELVRTLIWPGLQILAVRNPSEDRDFVLVRGVEPSMKWRKFSSELLDLAEDLEVELIVTLGSMLADTPHTRAIPVSITGAHPDMARKYGVEVSQYQGPTGILAAIASTSVQREIDSLSIWAAVPHYASTSPSPKATLGLLNELEDLLGFPLQQGSLPKMASEWQESVSDMTKEDSDIEEYIKSLEADRDATEIGDGEELAREVERFLRRQNKSDEQ